MAYRIDYKCLAEHWPLDEWPDQLSVYHQFTPNDKRTYINPVRCRDCEYYQEDPDPIDPGWPMMCGLLGQDMVEPYGFCAWGCRR